MKNEDFDEVIENAINRIRKVLQAKNKEYSLNNEDRFCNFKRAGKILKCSPEAALIGMWTKHLVSILDMMDELELKCGLEEDCFPSTDPDEYMRTIEEKISDAINYLILLEGLLKERRNNLDFQEVPL